MAFDPSTATAIDEQPAPGFDPSSASGFDASSAQMWKIPFANLIQIESGGNQFSTVDKTKPLTSARGAIGISQLLPATAKDAAKLAGVEFNLNKLRYDADYNKQLGEAYYNSLVTTFDGDSYKAAAAYNAGPRRVKDLIDTFGDDWAKHLPDETKNYINKLGYTSEVGEKPLAQDKTSFELTKPPLIDYKELLTSGEFGAAAQAGISLIPQVRGVAGAIRAGEAVIPALAGNLSAGEIAKAGAKGFVESVVGTAAGQYYEYGKPENADTDLTRMGIELATGAAYEPGIKLVKGAASIIDSLAPDFIAQFVTKPAKVLDKASQLNRKAVQEAAFGPVTKQPGTATDVFKSGLHKQQRKELEDTYNIVVPKGIEPQNYLRQQFSSVVNDLGQQGVLFKDSPQYRQMLAELDLIRAPKAVKEGIKRIANLQMNQVPEAAANFETYLLNLMQQSSGEFKVQDLEKISADLLKKHFDSFLVANTGIPYYQVLKKAEAENFGAIARDSIPTLIANGFTADKQALKNIKKSPEGVRDLKVAVTSYLKNIPDDNALLNKWNDLEVILKETKALPFEDIMQIKRQVNKARSLTGKAKVAATLFTKDALVTMMSAEASKKQNNRPAPTLSELFL